MGETEKDARTQDFTARTTGMTARTTPAGRQPGLTASGRTSRQVADEYRRQQATRAIARIQDCYRRGLAIPDVR